MFWSSLDQDPPKEATWEEYSSFEKDLTRIITFSELDHKEQCVVYSIIQRVPTYGGIDRDFIPTNFLSSYSIHSHKGRFHLFLNIVTNFYYNILQKNLFNSSENMKEKLLKHTQETMKNIYEKICIMDGFQNFMSDFYHFKFYF